MRDVAERRQQLEHDHEKALLALQKKKEEVKELQQAQVEARKEHEGAVQLLEGSLDCMQARVQELENQCRNHTEQFNFLCQELKRFRFQTGKIGHPPHASSPSTTMVMSEVTLASCSPSPSPTQHPDNAVKEKDRVLLSGSSSRFGQKIQSEDVEEAPPPGLWLPEHPIGCVVARSPDMLILPVTNRKPSKKVESQSSSSRSESIPTTSPKSCPTPEVDTASEMEELDIDSVSLIPDSESHRVGKLHVFLARYSYNPFDGPNENPEAELPLTAGEYIYVYGEMDDDGFFEGELMDGRRGLVPSNFVERVSDDDLVTFLPGEFSDLSQSSPLDRSFLSSGERSDPSTDDPNTVPLRLEGDPKDRETPNPEVPYPRKVTLIREFGSGLVVGWDPPFPSAGCPEVQSYQVFVDTELRQNVKAGGQTKAVLEKLDLRTKAYRISVQSVSEKGTSDCFRCTFLVGKNFPLAPIDLLVRNVEATSVELSWAPSNSNFSHVVYLNGEEHGVTKPGVYWYTFRSLKPNTSYAATVEVQPQWTFWESGQERQDQELFSAEIHFTTALAGSPDAPLDVRVEPGPSPGILVISWLPVTIDAEGSSNGVRVTGYALYADGQKVMEVTSPTAGSVLADISQLQMLQMCREVSVRTVSLYGESSDSVPAQIPSALLKDPSGPSLLPEPSCFSSQISCGRDPISPVAESKPNESEKLGVSSFGETSQNEPTALIVTHKLHSETPGMDPLPEAGRDGLVVSPGCNMTRKESEEGHQEESAHQARDLEISGGSGAPDVSMGEKPKDSAERKEASSGSGTPSDRRAPEPGISGRAKLSKDAIPKDEPTVLVTKTRREQGEKRSDPGNRQLNLLTDHPRSSDLSDIMEEEEEEEEEDRAGSHRPKWKPSESHNRENGEKEVRDVETEQLNSKSWRAPTRRGRRSRRKSREELAPSGSWRSSSPETMDEEDSLRLFVALFDYDPVSMSPNSDAAEEELPFQEGQILKVYGHKDADGFYRGECAGRIGYIPCNMVSEVQVDSQSARTQLLQDGRISTDMLVEHLDNGAFSPPRRPPRAHPPKPRRSKKAERKKQGTEGPGLGVHEIQDLSSEEDVPRMMVAIFDYNPQENSPNPDTEAELRFSAGDVVTVLSSMDDDGFYYAEINGQKGLVPSNFLEAVGSDGVCPGGVTLGRQGKQLS
nr:peripheral-type benzodiazepine receptor-associated protein 1 isoform X5 [Anolis sagrei ordinatus]